LIAVRAVLARQRAWRQSMPLRYACRLLRQNVTQVPTTAPRGRKAVRWRHRAAGGGRGAGDACARVVGGERRDAKWRHLIDSSSL